MITATITGHTLAIIAPSIFIQSIVRGFHKAHIEVIQENNDVMATAEL